MNKQKHWYMGKLICGKSHLRGKGRFGWWVICFRAANHKGGCRYE